MPGRAAGSPPMGLVVVQRTQDSPLAKFPDKSIFLRVKPGCFAK